MEAWPSASVVVVGYRSRRHLDRCLASVLTQAYPGRLEVMLVDNASGDGSADHVRATFPEVVVLETGANIGFAAANNRGAAAVRGEVLAFLNPDTEVAPGWLTALVRPLLDDPTVGLTTSKILLAADRERINACGNEISLSGITACRGADRPAVEFLVDADVAAISGCAFAVRADLFHRLGGFDPSFFMYLEDTDLSWRARAAGFRCRYVAASIVYHDYRLNLSAAKVGWIERNRYRLLGKHLSRRSLAALVPTLALAEVLTWGYAALSGPPTLLAKAKATATGVGDLAAALRMPASPGEGRLLRQHRPAPSAAGGVGGRWGQLAATVTALPFRAAAAVAFALLPAEMGTPRPTAAAAAADGRETKPVSAEAGWHPG